MINIDLNTLPENVQNAFRKFELCKMEYSELQLRLMELNQRLEKHRKSAEATLSQAEQLDAQWRNAFRENDGELTKEIRAMKNSAQESFDFSEEYKTLADALSPEFELCQLDTHDARTRYLSAAQGINQSYTDHVFTAALNELLTSTQMKLFLASLKSKFKLIEQKVNQSPLVSIGEEKESTELRQAKFLRDTFIELIEAAGDEASKETSFIHSDNVKALQEELQEVSVAAKIRRRNELNALIN